MIEELKNQENDAERIEDTELVLEVLEVLELPPFDNLFFKILEKAKLQTNPDREAVKEVLIEYGKKELEAERKQFIWAMRIAAQPSDYEDLNKRTLYE